MVQNILFRRDLSASLGLKPEDGLALPSFAFCGLTAPAKEKCCIWGAEAHCQSFSIFIFTWIYFKLYVKTQP